ncbi:DUF4249 domain-containing protein [Salinibacter grassmerensis]|uniref:DUF4249 domain-containing protein n=1 Tax=Salinibacter grassmerensis TaxID=3040353 RepID=UPI0021E7485E|nr:DUF4249 domain-containing protein [Salinibacter grassmerensis]
MRRLLLLAAVGLASSFLVGCDTNALETESQVVVEAYLKAGAELDSVRVTRTARADAEYTPKQTAVQGAEVRVQRLNDEKGVAESIPYVETDSVGVYAPEAPATVEPRTSYRLRVNTPEGTVVTATTTVPAPVEAVRTENDTTTYPDEEGSDPPQFELTIRPEPSTLERQNVYVLTSRSLLDFQSIPPSPPDSIAGRLLTPFYLERYDADSDTLASSRVNSSGLLNEANFTRNDDGTVSITLPWLAVAFYGPNQVRASVVDNNLYDFLRTQSAQQRSLAPGEIPNIEEEIENGTGVFGSYAEASGNTFIRPPDLPPGVEIGDVLPLRR